MVCDDGLRIEDLYQYKMENGKIEGFPESKFFSEGEAFLEHDCDILIPAAMEGVIDEKNAPKLKCKVLAEAANGPLTFG